jgi:hypothetical protein
VAKTISDPLGNKVFIPQTIIDLNKHVDQSEDVMDDMSKVIEKPIMLFGKKENQAQLYYLRAVGWNKTMLIGVQKKNGQLEVTSYEMDPSIERITELHSKFERLI